MYKVVTTDVLRPTIPEEAILKEAGVTLTYGNAQNEAELIELTRDADAIINVYIPITANVINSLERCKLIVRRGIGYDNVDVVAATAKGIPVANVLEYCIDEVADHTLALLLATARRIVLGNDQIRSGGWDYKAMLPVPALKDSTLGLIGFGQIPRAVAERARCFGLTIQTSDPFVSPQVVEEYGVKLVSLEELLKTSDYVSVHAPLSEKTRGMISKKEFALMKPTAVILNTARGPVIDETALIEALESGRIAAAALDVTAKEPPAPDNPLRKMDNVILTPHLAWYSERSARMAGEKAGEDVVRALNGYFPRYLVNIELKKTRTDLKQPD